MDQMQGELAAMKSHVGRHRIAVYGIVAFLVVLTFGVIVAFGLLKTAPSLPSFGQPAQQAQETTVDYQNPFDESSQYENPFSSYKNPFGELQ